MADLAQTLCCGCCAAITGFGIATFVFVAYISYYVLTTVFGCIIIYYGVALRNVLLSYSTFIQASGGNYLLYSSLCISVGTLFTVVVILGVWAQRKNQSKIMVLSAIIQLAIIVICIYSYFWAYPGSDGIEKFLSGGFDKSLENYNKTVKAWDAIQRDLECCGKKDFTSWQFVSASHYSYPPVSCCRKDLFDEDMDTCNHDADYGNYGRSAITIYVKGCLPKVKDEISGQMRALQRLLMPFLIITVIGFISSLCNTGAKKSSNTEGTMIGGLYVNVPKSKAEAIEAEKKEAEKGDVEAPEVEGGEGDQEKPLAIEEKKEGIELESVETKKA